MDASLKVSLGRIIAQGLVPATAARSPLEAVENLAALQGQQASAIPWAIGVRCTVVTRAQVAESFQSGELVRSWPMRDTLHVTSARDHHWLRRLLRHRYASWIRQSTGLGLSDALVENAAAAVFELLGENPSGVSRSEVIRAWDEAGIATVTSGAGGGVRRRHLVKRLFLDGVLVSGPLRGGEHLIVDARQLPGAPGVAKGESGHEEALALLAARYAWGHGPVDAADLARWAGLTLTEARRALAGARVAGESIGLPLAEFGGGLARADLADRVEDYRVDAEVMRALPPFDELHVGYKDRSCLTDEAGEALICPAKNGMFRPIVVEGGRVVAVRAPGREIVMVKGYESRQRPAARAFDDWEKWLSETQR